MHLEGGHGGRAPAAARAGRGFRERQMLRNRFSIVRERPSRSRTDIAGGKRWPARRDGGRRPREIGLLGFPLCPLPTTAIRAWPHGAAFGPGRQQRGSGLLLLVPESRAPRLRDGRWRPGTVGCLCGPGSVAAVP